MATHVSSSNSNDIPLLSSPLSKPSSTSYRTQPTPTKKTTPTKLNPDISLLSSIVPRLPSSTSSLTAPTKQPITSTHLSSGDQCAVCGDVAPPTTIFRRHYGVICCEACKCFFRRTVQMGRDYKCRFSGTCPVGRNAINIKQVCQACRFSRCTQAGMKIDSVKKFPRKPKEDKKSPSRKKNHSSSSSLLHSLDPSSLPPPLTTPIATADDTPPDDETTVVKVKQESPEDGEEGDYESDFEHFRFNVSLPDLSIYTSGALENTIPKLFSGESLENIHEKSSIPTPESVVSGYSGERRSPQVLLSVGSPALANSKASSPLKIVKQPSPLINAQIVAPSDESEATRLDDVGGGGSKDMTTPPTFNSKRPSNNVNWNEMLLKKQRLEDALNHITARQVQVKANLQRLSVQNTSYLSHPNLGSGLTPTHTVAPPPGLIRPSLSHMGNMPQDHTPYDHTPYVTPHDTPHGTPVPSPLPSPNLYHPPPPLHYTSQPPTPHPVSCVQNISQPGTPLNGSLPTSPSGYNATPTNSGGFYYQQHPPISYQSMGTLSVDQCTTNVPPLSSIGGPPLYHQTQHYANGTLHNQLAYSGGIVGGVRGGVIGSVPGSTVTSPTLDQDCLLPSFTRDSYGNLAVEIPDTDPELISINHSRRGSLTSAPTSACPSPLLKPSRTLASDAPEAEVEEVLESLKGSIKHMFKWAKSEVKDFDDLSPMDQKALLRRTVPELVMLGFARASIPYDDMLLLGGTGKVMRPSNANSGVSAVAIVTLSKLVVPLKVLNMDDQELRLMKEIVLFNPESNCLRDKETVREYRRRKHIELMEYSERNQPGRFGDILCLLTPLYEVSGEVTEQLRLEQFVHEGEARIDALLLMSMINQGGGVSEEPMEGGEPVM